MTGFKPADEIPLMWFMLAPKGLEASSAGNNGIHGRGEQQETIAIAGIEPLIGAGSQDIYS